MRDHPDRPTRVVSAARTNRMYPDIQSTMAMRIDQFTFGSIRIDGVIYEHDVVIAHGRVRKVRRSRRNPSAMRSATRRCLSRRTSPGTAGAWWSGPGPTAPFP